MTISVFAYFFPLVFFLLLIIILPLFWKLLNLNVSQILNVVQNSLFFFLGLLIYTYNINFQAINLLPTNLLYYFQINNMYFVLSFYTTLFVLSLIYLLQPTEFLFYNVWLLLILIFGLNLILLANNLVFLLFSLELVSLTIIIILTLYNNSAIGSNNLLNYFLLNSLISGFFYFSIFLSFIFNNYNLDFISWAFLYDKNNWTNFFLFFVFLFKLGVAPVHVIQLSVYEKLPWYLFFFILKIYKLVLFFVFCNFNYIFQLFQSNLFWIGLGSLIIGAIQPFWSFSLRNLLFSSSLFIYGSAFILLSINERILAFNFVFLYTLGSAILFFLFIYYESKINFSFDFINNLNLKNFSVLHFTLFFCTWFLSGIPPTIFFFYKASIIQIFLIYFGLYWTIGLIGIFVLATIGYFRLIKIFLFDINWANFKFKNFILNINVFLISTVIIILFSDYLNMILITFVDLINADFLKYY